MQKNKTSPIVRWSAIAAVSASALVLGGCAATGSNPQDPYESFNRKVQSFNDGVDDAVLKPVATAYQTVTPQPVRTGVGNFFGNVGDLWSMVNHLLQGNGLQAYNHMVRFTTNTVLGIGGLLDIATEMGVDRQKQDFGRTLGAWGIKPGPYLVLPLLGPSTVRDTVALPADWNGNVLSELRPISHRNALVGLKVVDDRARLLKAGDIVDSVALDRYVLLRDVYLQSRQPKGDGRVEDMDAGKLPPEE
ncbi:MULTISPECIES: MlaA family lipoprotein [Comamonas]|uniref:MlaA family lipoprotein n=1 Tax=Comamonas TaxID=283 RepID=UPI001C4407B7|nr:MULTISPECIES: VacJ family lipoprotein [Comamonas]MBV7418735.1 VacJ family lipoprotein [Comamonas sp. CMM03]MDH0047955.1 VacJ family lipoprotein [Comamonas terrigena]MDH0510445.1 VacJ family lipoprotein [Comamonas terrigena]MDH1090047.1 VacJ family lipoprotein [Comamonas terrigena]MDH1290182.1 VacJ family lipoprotein [Comamonas terrigena]